MPGKVSSHRVPSLGGHDELVLSEEQSIGADLGPEEPKTSCLPKARTVSKLFAAPTLTWSLGDKAMQPIVARSGLRAGTAPRNEKAINHYHD